MQGYAGICRDMQGYARICKDMQGYARICKDMQGYARICKDMQGYARICKDVLPLPSSHLCLSPLLSSFSQYPFPRVMFSLCFPYAFPMFPHVSPCL